MITLIMEGKLKDMDYMLTLMTPKSLAHPRIQECLKYFIYE